MKLRALSLFWAMPLLLTGAVIDSAYATPFTVTSAVGGAPTGVSYANFDNLTLGSSGGTSGGIGVTFNPDGQAVQGNSDSRYAAPYLSNNNGTLFGDTSNGPDATTYLTTGLGTVTLALPASEKYLGLLWGSVDDYNNLAFYSGGTLIGTVNGLDVFAGANGDQGVNGTFYVNINSTSAFDTVVASASQYAFEFDNVAYNPTPVPEPLSLSLLGLGILGVGAVSRSKGKKNAALASC